MALTSGQNSAAIAAVQAIVGATTTQSYPLDEMAAIAAVEQWVPIYMSADATALTAATLQTHRVPSACTILDWRYSLATAATVGIPAVDIRKNGTSIFTTVPTINTGATTSVGATTPGVLKTDGTATFAADDVLTVVGTVAGTSTAGLKVWLRIRRTGA